MFEITIMLESLLFLYAFSDDITYALAKKRAKRKAKKSLRKNQKEKGSDSV